jgi:putative membrane protein
VKTILRSLLINIGALIAASQIIPSLTIEGGLKGLMIGAVAFMLANLLLVPLLKVLLLPLNLLTLGIFAWLSNVLALYFLVTVVPYFKLLPYQFSGITYGSLTIAPISFSTFQLAIVVSFVIGFIIHFCNWLVK